MKLQHLAIIFVIIIFPISLVIGAYMQTQIDTITLQTLYSSKLQSATYDAIRSFQLNTINNKYSTVSDSKIRDIEASISTFYNSLGTSMGASGYDQDTLKEYIPSMLYTLYDGYYIYGKYYNYSKDSYQFGLKPYIYYSCRYVYGDNDFVVNYTLDNRITIYGKVNNTYVTKSGYLIKANNPLTEVNVSESKIGLNENITGYASLKYDEVKIESEILSEQLILLDSENVPTRDIYEYVTYNNRKIYYKNGEYFWCLNNQKQTIYDEDTKNYIAAMVWDGHLHSNSSVEYYYYAYEFSKWVSTNIGAKQSDAKDAEGNKIEFAVDTGESPIFSCNDSNNPLMSGSAFNENRVSVIRQSIETNLAAAIANYNSGSANTYEFVLPVFTEEDWNNLINNISIATFMQGIPIGSKYFNNYCIITNDKNQEVVTNDAIYVISEDDDGNRDAHFAGCKDVIDNKKKIIAAYKNVDFEMQTVVISEGNEKYFYPHADNKCYSCIVNVAQTYNLDEIISGTIYIYDTDDKIEKTINVKETDLRKIYLTALGRERQDLYKTNAYFDKK